MFLCQVFDGHGGKHAADFACNHLPRFIIEDDDFPGEIERVVASAFHQTDAAFAKACSKDAGLASGTTALAALVLGRLGVSYPKKCIVFLLNNLLDVVLPQCSNGRNIQLSVWPGILGGTANWVLVDWGTYFFPKLQSISNVVVFMENNTTHCSSISR